MKHTLPLQTVGESGRGSQIDLDLKTRVCHRPGARSIDRSQDMGLPPSSSSSRLERRTRKLLGRSWAVEQEEGKLLRKCNKRKKGFEGSSSTERRRERLGSGKWQEDDLGLCERSKLQEEEEERVEELLGLPHHDLLFKILSFLPLPKLFELRLVCKSWNTLLRSPAFLEAWSAEASSDEYWLVMARGLPSPRFAKEFIAYSPSLERKWLRLPLDSPTISSYLGLSSIRVAAPELPDQLLTLCACVAASAGGLMCFVVNGPQYRDQRFDRYDYTVLLLNVLTGAVRTLPPPPKHLGRLICTDRLSISMFANSTTNSYLVVLQHVLQPHHLEIYDSKTGSWKVARDITAAKCSGDVQSGDLFRFDFVRGTLSAYSIESDAWSQVQAPAPKVAWFRPTVTKYKGRVLYVNGLKFELRPLQEHNPTIQGFGVWELQSSTPGIAKWVEVARTPPQYWKGFFDLDASSDLYHEVKFIFHESLICMTGVHHTDYNHGGNYFNPLVYDLALDSWYHLPGYKGTPDFLGIFSFQPSFTAMV